MSSQHCTGERGVSRIFGEDCSCMAETLQHQLKTLNYKVIRLETENINNIFLIFSATFPMFLVRDFSVFSISSFFLVLIIDRRLYLFPAPAAGVEKFCFLNTF